MSFCKQLGAKELILTHFSQRYERPGDILEPGDDTTDKLVSEAKEAIKDQTGHGWFSDVTAGSQLQETRSESGSQETNFSCTVSAADDFKTYTIPARKS